MHEGFSRDPGSDNYQNLIIGIDMPEIIQDFGWRRANYTAGGPRGEIGGLFRRMEPVVPLCSYCADDVSENGERYVFAGKRG